MTFSHNTRTLGCSINLKGGRFRKKGNIYSTASVLATVSPLLDEFVYLVYGVSYMDFQYILTFHLD